MEAIRFEDDPWRRLAWHIPTAMLLTLTSLMGFVHLLEQAPPLSPIPRALDVQVVEITSPVSAPAPTQSPPPAPPKKTASAKARVSPTPPSPEPKHEITPSRESAPASVTAAAIATVPTQEATSAPAGEPSTASRQSIGTPSATPGPARDAGVGVPDARDLGGGRMGARAIYQPLPQIPEEFRRRNMDVVAIARFWVAANGTARVELTEPTSVPEINQALVESLKRWRFFPAMQNGKPITSTIDIRIPISVR